MHRLNLLEKAIFIVVILHVTTILYKELGSPIGVPYGRELLGAASIGFTFVVYLPWRIRNNAIMAIELHILGLTLFCWIIPGVFAYLYYGQPVLYGLIEERRVLGLLGMFPILYFAMTKSVTSKEILRYLIYAGIAAMCVIWLMYLTSDGSRVTPEGKVITKEELQAMGKRTSRIFVGSKYICLSTIFASVMFRYRKENKWLLYIVAVLATQFMACQGRTLFGLSCIFIAIITFRSPRMYTFLALAAFGGFVALLFFWEMLQNQIEGLLAVAMQYQKIATVQNMAKDVRSHSLLVVYSTLADNNYFGVGSLSLMWKNGFHRLYGQNFYLTDLGFPSTFMRYGIALGIAYMLYVAWLCFHTWKKLPPKTEEKEITLYAFVFLLALLPLHSIEVSFDHFAVVFFIAATARLDYIKKLNQETQKRRQLLSK
ncbi:MAG: hypothetical protein CMK59_13945 [Proteobacteria bacterium]|nr:hypothetical protein [Pseudomonadota bacterium]